MSTQGTQLNDDTAGIPTSGYYADAGDGTSRWFHWRRTANGGNVALGSTTDTADTATDATAGTAIGLLKGIISTLGTLITAFNTATGDLVGSLSNARTTALAGTKLVKASAGVLYGFQGYTNDDGYVLVIADPEGTLSGGEQALEVIPVVDPAGGGIGGPFSFDGGRYGISIATGITIAFSSTAPTYTAGGSAMFVSAQYT